jgi:hypothetical protein
MPKSIECGGRYVTFGSLIPSHFGERSSDVIRWILRRSIDKFERDWNNETTCMQNTIDANPLAAWPRCSTI